jgi:hypothetical protein
MNATAPTDTPQAVADAESFLRDLYGKAAPGHLVISSAEAGNERTPMKNRAFPAHMLADAARYAVIGEQGRHGWFNVGLRRTAPEPGKRGGTADVVAIPGVWADIDVAHPVHKKSDGLPTTFEAARDLIDDVGILPSKVWDTGHGLQAIWLFPSLWTFADDSERDAAQDLCNAFKRTINHHAAKRRLKVDAVADLARPLRLPSTTNVKDVFDPKPVRVVESNDCRYTPDEIRAVLVKPEPVTPKAEPKASNRTDPGVDHLPDDFDLIERARRAGNGNKFRALWDGDDGLHGGDTSAADLALCGILAFWTGKDARRIDRIFRMSRRWRDKWDAKHFANGDTYGAGTIATAIKGCREVYDPTRGNEPRADDDDSPGGGGADASNGAGNKMGPPIPLDARVPPSFPDGVFTGWLGDMVDAASRAHETPPELGGMLALSVLASVAQKRFTIRPEPGYFETLAIWAVCALVPGNRKSAVLTELARALVKWEREQAAKVGEERKLAESKRKTQEARIAELRAQAKKKAGADFAAAQNEIAELEAGLQEIPEPPRLFAQDVTPERLGSLLAENMERLTLLSDEGGVFDLLGGRYSDGIPNIDLVLQAHNGSMVRVDRGSRPPVVLNHPALSMGLSPQPDVLAGVTKHKGFRGRGLLARFLYAVPVSRLGYRNLDPCPIPDDVKAAYEAAIESLANVPANVMNGEERARIIYPSPEAWRVWKAWQREVEAMMREGGRLENLTDWGGKLPGATARIAGLLHLADYASCPESCNEVTEGTMARAIVFARFLLEHALIAFDLMGADVGLEAARKLWRAIEAKRAATFTSAEIWHPLRGTFVRAKDAEPGFEVLVEHNYIEELHTAERGKAGRPSRRFRVNPVLVEGWR